MIAFEHARKVFVDPRGAAVVAVDDLVLEIERGETHCLLGTSGCGKTTTMKLINRLEEPDSGRVLVDGDDVAEADVIRLRRRIGYVIQTGGLFPHLSVARNVGLLAELEGRAPAQVRARVCELLELVNLQPTEFAERLPHELSGGQRQRVGVARALVLDPPIVLMDEPFGALDPITRAQIQAEFKSLLARVQKTVVMVTHDLAEAFELGDRITLMHEGRIVQTGTADQLRQEPATPFVREFLAGHLGYERNESSATPERSGSSTTTGRSEGSRP
ncbi:MAG: ATP-binding cassette domain-containing protein [Planctomycetota bacterium]